MINKIKYKLARTVLLSILIADSIIGWQSNILEASSESIQNSNLISVNVRNFELDKTKYLDLYINNKYLFFNFENNNSENLKLIMMYITGITIQGKYILLQKTPNGPNLTSFPTLPTETEVNKYIQNRVLSRQLGTPQSKNFTINLMKKNMKCEIPLITSWYQHYDPTYISYDYCDGNMSVDLIYTIVRQGSIRPSQLSITQPQPTNSQGTSTPVSEGKFVIISISPNEGGTG